MTKINTCGYVNQYFQEAEKMLTLICIQAIMTTRKMSKYRTHVLQFIIGPSGLATTLLYVKHFIESP